MILWFLGFFLGGRRCQAAPTGAVGGAALGHRLELAPLYSIACVSALEGKGRHSPGHPSEHLAWPLSCSHYFTFPELVSPFAKECNTLLPRAIPQLLPHGTRQRAADFGHNTGRTALAHALPVQISYLKSISLTFLSWPVRCGQKSRLHGLAAAGQRSHSCTQAKHSSLCCWG